MQHLLSIEQLSAKEIQALLDSADYLKRMRGRDAQKLAGQTWALIFTKSSTRTRVSFEVGIRELGGFPMFLSKNDIQLGRDPGAEVLALGRRRNQDGVIAAHQADDQVADTERARQLVAEV